MMMEREVASKDIRHVEAKLLKLLDWKLAPPSSFMFARDFIQAIGLSEAVETNVKENVMSFLRDITGGMRWQLWSTGTI